MGQFAAVVSKTRFVSSTGFRTGVAAIGTQRLLRTLKHIAALHYILLV